MKKADKSLEMYRSIMEKIEMCNTEDELEKVSDLVDDCQIARIITRKAYKALEEALDERLMTLIEEGKI